MTKRFFVTGTDTEVGKTIASSALLQAANLLGFHTAGYKPVASGSELTGDGLRNEDALALQRHSRVALRYDQVNPYTFAEPTSPHIISADEGRPIAAARLSSGLRELEGLADWVLVEGAGGWFTPLSDSLMHVLTSAVSISRAPTRASSAAFSQVVSATVCSWPWH